jgi:hypothetical protein
MGSDCYFQVLNLGALATMIGVTKLHMDDYTKFHPTLHAFIKKMAILSICYDYWGYL